MKFEMSIKELSFKFEGDFEQGQKIQTGISKALGEIANLQSGALGLPPVKPAEARVIETFPPARTRRRRKKPEAVASEAEALAETNDSERGAARKSTGSSPMRLLKDLRKTDFFEGGRTVGEIVSHVNAKGHTKLVPGSFSAQLQALSKRDVLRRTPDDVRGWVYFPGTKDE